MADQQTYAQRAVAAYEAMQRYLYLGGRHSLYRETHPASGGNPYCYVWPLSRALIGTLSLAGVPDNLGGGHRYHSAVAARLRSLAAYWDGAGQPPAYDSYVVPPLGQGGDKYHDDNAWLALALIQVERMGLAATLDRAEQLFAFARSGWDNGPAEPFPGGVFWVQQGAGQGLANHDRGTGATAGSAELGFHLRDLTGSAANEGDGSVAASPASLGARNMFNWVNAFLDSRRSGTGPYWNAVRRDGSIDTNVWSYNQGVMIGANVLQYRLTGNGQFLQQAEAIASETLRQFGDFTGQPPSFNAMCCQDLLRLHAVTADSGLRTRSLNALRGYADWAWDTRDPTTSLFYFSDGGQPALSTGQPARLQDQGAMVQLYALLAWDPADYGKLA